MRAWYNGFMKRPAMILLIGYISGILIYVNSKNPSIYPVVSIFLLIVFLSVSPEYRKKTCWILAIPFILGIGYSSLTYQRLYPHTLYEYDNRFIEGYALTKNLKDKGDKVLLIARILKIEDKDMNVTVSMEIPVDTEIMPGDLLHFQGMLTVPTEQRNPGNFNRLHYMASKGLSAKINAPKILHIQQRCHQKPVLNSAIKLRRMIISRIEETYPEKHAALLSGMIIGYTARMDEHIMEAFSLSGLTHIMAVSGANVIFVITPLLFVFKKLGLNIFISNLLFIPVLIFYSFITGLEASIVRASVMAIIGFIGMPLLRKSDTLNTLCVSCLCLLTYNPFMLLDVGFILSYGATLGIVLLYPYLRRLQFFVKLQGFITDTFLSALAATFSILPFSIKFFYMITPYSLIANLLIIPLTGLITLCGMCSICVPLFLGKLFAYPVITVLELMMRITGFISQLPGAKLMMNTPSDFQIAIYYLVVFYFLFRKEIRRNRKLQKVVLVSVAVLWVLNYGSFHWNQAKVTFIDVGQGDSIFIKTGSNKIFLVDGGGSATYDVGQNTVIPFLLSQHARKIDGLFSTHNDIDHIGGLVSVADTLVVKNAFLPYLYQYSESETVQSLIKNSRNVTFIQAGQTIVIDKDTSIKVLWPSITTERSDSKNHLSLVLLFQYKNFKVLLTGDLDGEGVYNLMSLHQDLDCSVLKIPHHGGDNPGMGDLLEQSLPDLAIISVGKNKYGHPTREILDILDQYGVPTLRTDYCGAITVKTNGSAYSIKTALD